MPPCSRASRMVIFMEEWVRRMLPSSSLPLPAAGSDALPNHQSRSWRATRNLRYPTCCTPALEPAKQ
jgi:hypothetical protein